MLSGVDRIEINKPRLEQRLRDGFEGGVGFAQQGNAVVESTDNSRNTLLYCQRWQFKRSCFKNSQVRMRYSGLDCRVEDVLQLFRRLEQVVEKNHVGLGGVDSNFHLTLRYHIKIEWGFRNE